MFRHYGRIDTNFKGIVTIAPETLQCLLINGSVSVPFSCIQFDVDEGDYFLCFQINSLNKEASVEITIFALVVTMSHVLFDIVCGDLDEHWSAVKEDYINDEA
ncbi:hypothetical protein C9J12_08165 [Photobacterium frigidiphilum]|uniref:Uncharacterized protein n=1 Tax=Photobacterium frigidiphilum TaxID=264736 RepID=A0A2T3JKA5_9GAMM|nr:hypothetical protein [Photobacterium frigidiphilum]PSU49454.1 hypothetical protein C9J12_08165 [Photobacterium frigidiphilum]